MFFKEPNSLKSLIIQALADKHPLAVSELKIFLTRKHKRRFTFQAIHKCLNQLIGAKVVIRQDHRYHLDPDYILELESFINSLKEKYFQPFRQTFYVPDNQEVIYHPESIAALDVLWNNILEEKIAEMERTDISFIQHFPHVWFNLVHMDQEIKIVSTIMSRCHAFYTLVNGSTPLDALVGRFYRGPRSFYKMRINSRLEERGHCYGVLGSYILETYYPRPVAARLDRLFNSSTNIQEVNISELIALANTPIKLKLTLRNNVDLAAKYRRVFHNEFRSKDV